MKNIKNKATDTKLPSLKDWGDIPKDNIDLNYIYKIFFEKTNSEVQTLFNGIVAIEYVDALRWMPARPFSYYIKGFIDFILNKHYAGIDANDAAYSFLRLIKEKVDSNKSSLLPLKYEIISTIDFIISNQDYFRLVDDEESYKIYQYIKSNL